MAIIQRVALEHRCLFLLQLYCSLSSHDAMTVLTSTKGFESVNAVPEDYGDADCGITLARSTLTFFRPGMLSGTVGPARRGFIPTQIYPVCFSWHSEAIHFGGQGRKIGERAAAGPWIAALTRNNRPSY
jgi:hypothetical protein